MNCQEFGKYFSRVPGGECEPDAGIEAHLLECPACAAYLARQRELIAGLHRVAESLGGIEAPARVEARLLGAFRRLHGVPLRAQNRRWLAPFAWAATVLLAVGLSLTGPLQMRPGGVAAASESPSVEPAVATSGDEAALESDGFIPLPSATRIGPNDGFNLVRVEIPRTAMMAVGIPVSADRASDLVEADVLLGSDGLARAVRFSQ